MSAQVVSHNYCVKQSKCSNYSTYLQRYSCEWTILIYTAKILNYREKKTKNFRRKTKNSRTRAKTNRSTTGPARILISRRQTTTTDESVSPPPLRCSSSEAAGLPAGRHRLRRPVGARHLLPTERTGRTRARAISELLLPTRRNEITRFIPCAGRLASLLANASKNAFRGEPGYPNILPNCSSRRRCGRYSRVETTRRVDDCYARVRLDVVTSHEEDVIEA